MHMTAKELRDKVLEAGVIGAGGAGFPTHVKLAEDMEYLIVNGVECEPLLYTDYQILEHYDDKLLKTLNELLDCHNIKNGVVAIKAKHKALLERLTAKAYAYPAITVKAVKNIYPVGDEVTLVHECTKRVVPVGELPSRVGCVILNVETLLNISNKLTDDQNVTHTYVTIGGEVQQPVVMRVPIGALVRDVMSQVELTMEREQLSVLIGGPMMGSFGEMDTVITKTTKGIILLPKDHSLHIKKAKVTLNEIKRVMGCCSQCRMCTDMCSRNRLGHGVYPHKVMNAFANGMRFDKQTLFTALGCSECNLCSYHVCHHGLNPSKLMGLIKKELRKQLTKEELKFANLSGKVSQMQVPTENMIRRLGLSKYNKKAILKEETIKVLNVFIPTNQHIGARSVAQVKVGAEVKENECIGTANKQGISSQVHASASGTVVEVNEACIVIKVNA